MKKTIVLLLCLPMCAGAQSLIGGNNIIKWNLGSLAFRNFHFTYERSLTRHISFSLSYRTMSKGSVPFQSQLEKAISSPDISFSNFQMGNTAWTPEVRFYLGLGKMKGFYLAPYARFATFDLTAPVNYTNSSGGKSPANFIGKVTSSSGGLMIGWQVQLATKLVMDIQVIGGHYGHSSGNLDFTPVTPLNPQEQAALKQSLNNIKADPFKFTSTVRSDGSGAQIITDGPWAGIRGANIGIGLRF